MPNYCGNTVNIWGSKKAVDEFCAQIHEEFKNGGGLLNYCRPMPAELRGTAAPTKVVSELEYRAQTPKKYFGGAITIEMQRRLLNDYGADNWYDWAVKYWGTKWEVTQEDVELVRRPRSVRLRFITAWSPPIEALESLAKKSPALHISIKYSEPGTQLRGRERIQ